VTPDLKLLNTETKELVTVTGGGYTLVVHVVDVVGS
jgi:hypothetical protein